MPATTAVTNLSNSEIVKALGLPADIITKLQTEQGDTFSATANQFISALVNKIVYSKVDRMEFANPFKKYESFPVRYGDTIENIFTECPVGYTFDKDATDPFTKVVPNVKVLYASINYEMQYCNTIQDTLLRRAALNEFGFMQLIESILANMGTRKSVDEYTATIAMLNNADLYADGFETVDCSAELSASEVYKKVTQKIIDTVTDFAIPCASNNKLKVLNVTKKSDVVLIIKQELLNHINLDYLAGVFNLSKVDLIGQIIPVRSFKVIQDNDTGAQVIDPTAVGEDLDFVVMDAKCFDIHPALEDSGMIYNPKGKYTNHYTNSWKIISFKYFHNARAFKVTLPSPAAQSQQAGD